MLSLTDTILEVNRRLVGAKLDYAIGGALALMHYTAEPRATRDIDINVFVDIDRIDEVLLALNGLIQIGPADRGLFERDGQMRFIAGNTVLDIFLSVSDFHLEIQQMVEMHHFGKTQLPYISATHLTVLKALFDRPKDWVDILEICRFGSLDSERALGWLVKFLKSNDERIAKLRAFALSSPDYEPKSFNELIFRNR